MEIGALQKGKGKSNNKGSNKGNWMKGAKGYQRQYQNHYKGTMKGKGKTYPNYKGQNPHSAHQGQQQQPPTQKWCNYCQRTGHWTSECWHKGKGKGKPKGSPIPKGKGKVRQIYNEYDESGDYHSQYRQPTSQDDEQGQLALQDGSMTATTDYPKDWRISSVAQPVGFYVGSVHTEYRVKQMIPTGVVSTTYLMIDSGAQACVCPLHHAEDCPITPLPPGLEPTLRTVTGTTMKCHGVKYVDYLLNDYDVITVRYYACEGVAEPVLSVDALLRCNYHLHLTERSNLTQHNKWLCPLLQHNGLHYLHPRAHRLPKDYENWTPEKEKQLHSHFKWLKLVCTTKHSSDYWKIEGDKAIRVHTKPRLNKYSPTVKTTSPGSGKDTDPYYDLLGPVRTTYV